MWTPLSKDWHFTPQATLARPESMHYHFIGLLSNSSDVQIYWDQILRSPMVKLNARPEQKRTNVTDTDANMCVWPILWKLYEADYQMMQSFGITVTSDPLRFGGSSPPCPPPSPRA